MSEILYNFTANNSSLDDISGNIIGHSTKSEADIDNVFNILATVYTGEGATALEQAHQKFSDHARRRPERRRPIRRSSRRISRTPCTPSTGPTPRHSDDRRGARARPSGGPGLSAPPTPITDCELMATDHFNQQ